MLASLTLALMLMQYGTPVPYGGRRVGPRSATAVPSNGNPDAVATFSGEFKSADKKFLTIAVEDDQTMRMFITGGTKFIRDGKPVKASEFHTGDLVTVDATRDARMNLLAVKVEIAKPPAPATHTEVKPPSDQ